MRILIPCEFSGIMRDAFIAQGHDAVSCDLLPSERPGPHIQGDVLKVFHENGPFDAVIAFVPCFRLAVCGARWFKGREDEQEKAVKFFMDVWNLPVNLMCIENPVGIMSTRFRKPDQIIQPWMFGHPETKATCLWLRGFPKLEPTNIVSGREHRIWRMPPGPDRWKERSRTFQGVADAMSIQWGKQPKGVTG